MATSLFDHNSVVNMVENNMRTLGSGLSFIPDNCVNTFMGFFRLDSEFFPGGFLGKIGPKFKLFHVRTLSQKAF